MDLRFRWPVASGERRGANDFIEDLLVHAGSGAEFFLGNLLLFFPFS
jgi:hypothetical protein